MDLTRENIAWAVEKMNDLSGLTAAPKNDQETLAFARAFLRILGDQEPNTYYEDPGPDYEGEVHRLGKPVHVPGHAAKETGDWLVEAILDSCDRFPAPIKMREIYCGRGWKCGDGKDVWDHVKAFTKAN